jgi:hypothetical protein
MKRLTREEVAAIRKFNRAEIKEFRRQLETIYRKMLRELDAAAKPKRKERK